MSYHKLGWNYRGGVKNYKLSCDKCGKLKYTRNLKRIGPCIICSKQIQLKKVAGIGREI